MKSKKIIDVSPALQSLGLRAAQAYFNSTPKGFPSPIARDEIPDLAKVIDDEIRKLDIVATLDSMCNAVKKSGWPFDSDESVLDGALDIISKLTGLPQDEESEGDGICDTCMSSGVEIARTENGKTVCTDCDEDEDGTVEISAKSYKAMVDTLRNIAKSDHAALDGDNNDAEHDALFSAAEDAESVLKELEEAE